MDQADEGTFRSDLIALMPQVRAFSRSLCGDSTAADDLAQDTLARAWSARDRFTVGTHLKAWLFTILRNQFYSDKRRAWRSRPLEPDDAERGPIPESATTSIIELDELRRALAALPPEGREALILVSAAGLSYDEVGSICGIAAGTVKSRVARAREKLLELLSSGRLPSDEVRAADAFDTIMRQAQALRYGHRACLPVSGPVAAGRAVRR